MRTTPVFLLAAASAAAHAQTTSSSTTPTTLSPTNFRDLVSAASKLSSVQSQYFAWNFFPAVTSFEAKYQDQYSTTASPTPTTGGIIGLLDGVESYIDANKETFLGKEERSSYVHDVKAYASALKEQWELEREMEGRTVDTSAWCEELKERCYTGPGTSTSASASEGGTVATAAPGVDKETEGMQPEESGAVETSAVAKEGAGETGDAESGARMVGNVEALGAVLFAGIAAVAML